MLAVRLLGCLGGMFGVGYCRVKGEIVKYISLLSCPPESMLAEHSVALQKMYMSRVSQHKRLRQIVSLCLFTEATMERPARFVPTAPRKPASLASRCHPQIIHFFFIDRDCCIAVVYGHEKPAAPVLSVIISPWINVALCVSMK